MSLILTQPRLKVRPLNDIPASNRTPKLTTKTSPKIKYEKSQQNNLLP